MLSLSIHSLDFLLDRQMLELANKFENALTNTFQHELNTPLNLIINRSNFATGTLFEKLTSKIVNEDRADEELKLLKESLHQIWCQGKSMQYIVQSITNRRK